MGLQIDKAGREMAHNFFGAMAGAVAGYLASPYVGTLGRIVVFLLTFCAAILAIEILIAALAQKKIVTVLDDESDHSSKE